MGAQVSTACTFDIKMAERGAYASYTQLAGPLEQEDQDSAPSVDQTQGAIGFFVNIRVPAALCASASLSSLFLFFHFGMKEVTLPEILYTAFDP